jgi:hypothetical protein
MINITDKGTKENQISHAIHQAFIKKGKVHFTCQELNKTIGQSGDIPSECTQINGNVQMICLVDGKTKKVSTYMNYLNQIHKPNYDGDFEKDALLACEYAEKKTNKILEKKGGKKYQSHGAHLLSYGKGCGCQSGHTDSSKANKACIMSTCSGALPTHIFQVPKKLKKINNLHDLATVIEIQVNVLQHHRCYPSIQALVDSLSPILSKPTNQDLKDGAPLLILPCLWVDDKIRIFECPSYLQTMQPPPLKRSRLNDTESITGTEEQKSASKRIIAEEARGESEYMGPESTLDIGDMLVMDGGVPHRGLADPGHSKIYFNMEPKTKDGEKKQPYEHESQVDMLEVWVKIGVVTYHELSVEHRCVLLRHICFAYALAMCQQGPVYTRYTPMGFLYIYFMELESVFNKYCGISSTKKKGSKKYIGNSLAKDPKLLFSPTEFVTREDEYQAYSISEKLENVLDAMYKFSVDRSWQNYDDLFTTSATPINLEGYLVDSSNEKPNRKRTSSTVAVHSEDGTLSMSDKTSSLKSGLRTCEMLDNSFLKIVNSNTKNNYIVAVQVYQDISTYDENQGSSEGKGVSKEPTLVQEEEEEEEVLFQDSKHTATFTANVNDQTGANCVPASFKLTLLESTRTLDTPPSSIKITKELAQKKNIAAIIKDATVKNQTLE